MAQTVLNDLKKQVALGRAVLVVGSGVSVAATNGTPAASWGGLLKLGVRHCVDLDPTLAGAWEDRALGDIASPHLADLLAGASKIERTLRKQREWSRWLEDTVGRLTCSEPELVDALGSLGAPILTTNYDGILERRLHRHPITWRDSAEQIAFTRLESCETILHLHGFWRDPDSVILDVGDYERIVGDQLTQAGLRTLGEAWSLVFVGCGEGLADPNFEQFLDWIGDVLKDARHRHFRLERADDVARRQQWHNGRGHRVRVIPYGEEHKDLAPFIASLRSVTPPRGAAAPSPEPAPPVRSVKRPEISAGEYVRLQTTGRAAVEQLIALASQLGWESTAAHGEELAGTLEEDLYRVAIAGRSRAGKSTLVNALVGRTVCPVERVVTTAIPIIIGPGEKESAVIAYEGTARAPLTLDGPITVDMLAPYADQKHNPNNEKKVERITVRLGHEVLDLGVEYVDIPGFDDPSKRIWSATNEVIENAHALVLVLDVSTYADGGFAIDMPTKEFLVRARDRGTPVFMVCNKADKLSLTDKRGVASFIRAQIESFGVASVMSGGPYFLTARDAIAARLRGEALLGQFAAFEEALWERLWKTEAVGLRRLYKVFDALRVADEEAAALMRARYTKGPERERLYDALTSCREDERRLRKDLAAQITKTRATAAGLVDKARIAQLKRVADHIASIPKGDDLPTISATVEKLHGSLSVRCTSVVEAISPTLTEQHERIDNEIERSLSHLRELAGLSAEARQARETMKSLSSWAASVGIPESGSGAQTFKVRASGVGTFALVGASVGGPVGWLLGAGIGFLVSTIVDRVTDTVSTREELREKVEQSAHLAFSSFQESVDAAIVTFGRRLDERIQHRMQPFMNDMEGRLESIREPTEDEVFWHAEMHRATAEALAVLNKVLARE